METKEINKLRKDLVNDLINKVEESKTGATASQVLESDLLKDYLRAGLTACKRLAQNVDGDDLHVSYIGAGSISAKLMKSAKNDYFTYGIYLAPSNMSGYNVCPVSANCRDFCLSGSGHALLDARAGKNTVNAARVRRTLLFFRRRVLFLAIVLLEIIKAYLFALSHNMHFAIRLNCTSDLNPVAIRAGRLNILDCFPNFQFYDYTKVKNHLDTAKRYSNYDLTFSHDGHNWQTCKEMLDKNIRVAVVFDCINQDNRNYLPDTFNGVPVVSGDLYDMRFLDPQKCIIGLTYHHTANDEKSGVYVRPETPFVIRETDDRIK